MNKRVKRRKNKKTIGSLTNARSIGDSSRARMDRSFESIFMPCQSQAALINFSTNSGSFYSVPTNANVNLISQFTHEQGGTKAWANSVSALKACESFTQNLDLLSGIWSSFRQGFGVSRCRLGTATVSTEATVRKAGIDFLKLNVPDLTHDAMENNIVFVLEGLDQLFIMLRSRLSWGQSMAARDVPSLERKPLGT